MEKSLFIQLMFRMLNQCQRNGVELHLSELIGMAIHPNMQNIRIIEFFFEKRLHWQFNPYPANVENMVSS